MIVSLNTIVEEAVEPMGAFTALLFMIVECVNTA